MNATRPASLGKPEIAVAQIAKAAFRRLAVERLEPTPENYARAYRHESGEVEPSADALATLIERIVRGVERGGHNWTPARRKDGIQRVLAGSRSDVRKLQHRLSQLVNSWEADAPATNVGALDALEPAATSPVPMTFTHDPAELQRQVVAVSAAATTQTAAPDAPPPAWDRVARSLGHALQQALPRQDDANKALADDLAGLFLRMDEEGATAALADEAAVLVHRAERVLQHRHHLFEQLGKLCGELTSSLTELAEDGSWVKGQCGAMRLKRRSTRP